MVQSLVTETTPAVEPDQLDVTVRPEHRSVAALVPAHNEAETITAVIEAIQQQTYPVERIIVVADNCTDATAELARSAGAEVHETAFGDKALAQNTVLNSITSEFLLGFDGDTVPRPECLERMMRDIEKNNNDATCSTVLPIQPTGFFIRARRFAYALGRRWWRVSQSTVGRIQVLTGASYLFKTDAINAVGGFTTTEKVCSSDMPTTWLLHKAGYKCGYAGDAEALTYDPETFRVYWAQMQRWSSGYFQTIAWHKRQMLHWRSILVVWTAIFDLFSLFWAQGFIVYMLARGHTHYLGLYVAWVAAHQVFTTTLVATVVGWKEALLGVIPYTIVNWLNKFIYLNALLREWVLGRHWQAWTGRQGRKTQIQPMTRPRRRTLTIIGAGAVLSAFASLLHSESSLLASLAVTITTLLVSWVLWLRRSDGPRQTQRVIQL